jgi:hypothetical protein
MSTSLQDFLVGATQKAKEELETALLRLPEEKRGWAPSDSARSALDQAAECALLNGSTTELIKTRKWNFEGDFSDFLRKKAELAQSWDGVKALLDENTAKVTAAIGAVPTEDLGVTVETPFGSMTLAQILSYPYWNMTYHQGQINYIASILGVLN